MEAVMTEAVALLDEAGEPALTFRALATRLGTGVGSIYWYVSGKDVLAATDRLPASDDPIDGMRAIAIVLFEAIADRPWLGDYFMRDTGVQPNGLKLYDRLGQQVLRLDLTRRERFHAVSAVIGYVVGIAADLGQQPPEQVLAGEISRDAYLAQWAEQWRALDPAEFPYMHEVADEFEGHDDAEQFRAGLDLLLAGLRLQAGTS
jgi:AcrR family transcriptional regulator